MNDVMKAAGWLVAWPLRAVGMVLGYVAYALADGFMDGLDAARKWRGKV